MSELYITNKEIERLSDDDLMGIITIIDNLIVKTEKQKTKIGIEWSITQLKYESIKDALTNTGICDDAFYNGKNLTNIEKKLEKIECKSQENNFHLVHLKNLFDRLTKVQLDRKLVRQQEIQKNGLSSLSQILDELDEMMK